MDKIIILKSIQILLNTFIIFKHLQADKRDKAQRKNLFNQIDVYFTDMSFVKDVHEYFHILQTSLSRVDNDEYMKSEDNMDALREQIIKDFGNIERNVLNVLPLKKQEFCEITFEEFDELIKNIFGEKLGVRNTKQIIVKLSSNLMKAIEDIETFTKKYEIACKSKKYDILRRKFAAMHSEATRIVSLADNMLRLHLEIIQQVFLYLQIEIA